MNIVVYSTGCAQCNVLATKLAAKGIEYQAINDIDIIRSKGIMSVPVMEVDGELMTFKKAVEWVNNLPGDKA